MEDGLTIIRELSARYERGMTPNMSTPSSLLMSAHASHEIALRAIELGASDFIAKPFEVSELIFHLRKMITERALRERVYLLEDEVIRGVE